MCAITGGQVAGGEICTKGTHGVIGLGTIFAVSHIDAERACPAWCREGHARYAVPGVGMPIVSSTVLQNVFRHRPLWLCRPTRIYHRARLGTRICTYTVVV